MIAMSDAVILLVSATVLGSGIYRWQANIDHTAVVSASSARVSSVSADTAAPDASLVQQTTSTRSGNETQDDVVVMRTQGSVLMGKQSNSISDAVPQDQNTFVDQDSTSNPTSKTDEPLYGVHVVVSGDTLSVLSQRFGTTVSNLRGINGISGSLINIGQEIRYPLPAN